jgi:hypothetical protein
MFCPRCGSENRLEQKYCRQCGMALAAVRLSLEGRVDDAIAELKQIGDRLAGGAVTLGIFALISLVTGYLWYWNGAANLLIGLLIAGPLIYRGLRHLERVVRLLNPEESREQSEKAFQEHPAGIVAPLPAVPDTDPLEISTTQPDAVTEQTTLRLKPPVPRN